MTLMLLLGGVSSSFNSNRAEKSGGALSAQSECSVFAERSLFDSNTVQDGGTIDCEQSTVYCNFCSFTDIGAKSSGGP